VPEDSPTIHAGSPELGHTSEAEEMYLITVARAGEAGASGPLSVGDLAAALSVKVASANEMVRKLAARDLVEYIPYRGVELTAAGRAVASRVLRIRRLWATFLAEHLDFSATEADDLACNLEHVTPAEAADRLAAFLGDPVAGPLGNPIPPTGLGSETYDDSAPGTPLTDVAVGHQATVTGVPEDSTERAFLAAESIAVGASVRVLATGASGVLVDAVTGRSHLSVSLAAALTVRVTDA
jgi:DtxR family Mn-dependent transcriptional regulator